MSERTLILGGGVAGLATAWFLARHGVSDVTLVEQETQLGTHSTGRNAGILRTWTGDPATRRLADESAAFLNDPPGGFSDVPLVDPVGLILVTDPGRSFPEAPFEEMERERGDLEELDADRMRRLAPHFEPDGRGWMLRDEGRLDTAAIVAGFARGAREGGAELRLGTRVVELCVSGGAVRGARLADGTELPAERVVLAAGGWAGRLGAAAGSQVRLRPTRRHLLVTAADRRVDPRWPVVWTDADPFYARPESGGLLISACDVTDVDPDDLREDPAVRELVARKAARFLPRFADAGVAHFWAGVRTLTADDRFVIGPDADVPGLSWVAGLGGHGMTCSAGIGRLAAELLLERCEDREAAAAVSPARFTREAVR